MAGQENDLKPIDLEHQPSKDSFNNGHTEFQPLYVDSQSSAQLDSAIFKQNGFAPVPSVKRAWKPSKGTMILTCVALACVAGLAFGLIFGLPGDDDSSSNTGTLTGTASSKELAEGPFWQAMTPNAYDVRLQLKPEHFTFDPTVPGGGFLDRFQARTAITFNVSLPSESVVVHAQNLTFTAITLQPNAGDQPVTLCSDESTCSSIVSPITERQLNTTFDQDLVLIDLGDNQLKAGSLPVITFEYVGRLGTNATFSGLHRSSPFAVCDDTGTQCTAQTLVATQLERTGARKVFPSFDGPSFKAVFTVTIEFPDVDGMVALSNTEEDSTAPGSSAGLKAITFKPSPIMSPYLMAIAVGQMKETKPTSASSATTGRKMLAGDEESGYHVHAWAAAGREANLVDALGIAEKALDFYDEYFGVSQPLKRFDLVAIPGKHYSMENWGLLLLDEDRSFHNPTSDTSAYGKWLMVDVICHELAHQWMGNLITCPDWMQLFVNEGLATALEYECIEAVTPEMLRDVMQFRATAPTTERIGVHEGPFSLALKYGADPMQPPMYPETDFNLDNEGTEYITYSKSASFFRMAAEFLESSLRFYVSGEAAEVGSFFRSTNRRAVREKQFSTISFYEWMAISYDEVNQGWLQAQANGATTMQPALKNFLDRTKWYLDAQTPEAQREVGTNGNSTVAAWAYLPAFPQINAHLPNMVDPNLLALTFYNLGGNQTRFCDWEMTADEAKSAGLSDQAAATIMNSCASPIRFSVPIVLDNLTDCTVPGINYNISTIVGMDSLNGSLGHENWVANWNGQRIWRTRYNENHFNNLMSSASGMVSCSSDDFKDQVGEGQCCADMNDVIEASALLSDSIQMLYKGSYPGNWAMQAIDTMLKAPVSYSGLGQYLLVLPALEGLLRMKPLLTEDATCMANYNKYTENLLSSHLPHIYTDLTNGSLAATTTEASRQEFLVRMSGAQVLWRTALFQTGTEEASTASAPAPAGGLATAPAKTPSLAPVPTTTPMAAAPTSPAAAATPTSAPGPSTIVGRRLQQIQQPTTIAVVAPATVPSPSTSDDETVVAPSPVASPATSTAPTPAVVVAATPAAAPAKAPTAAAATAGTGDSEDTINLHSELCSQLRNTPLWRKYVAGISLGETAAANVSADLLPAIYAVAAVTRPDCEAEIKAAYSTSSIAQKTPDVHKGVLRSLSVCWLQDADYAEASRCLYALPMGIRPNDYAEIRSWIANPSLVADTDDPTMKLRVIERRQLLEEKRPLLFSSASNYDPNLWLLAVKGLQGDVWRGYESTSQACGLIENLRPPVTAEERNAWQAVLAGNAKQCPEEIRARATGRAMAVNKITADARATICNFVASEVA